MKLLYSNRFILNGGLKKVNLLFYVFTYCDFIHGHCLTYKKRVQKVLKVYVRYIFGLRKFGHVSQEINEQVANKHGQHICS